MLPYKRIVILALLFFSSCYTDCRKTYEVEIKKELIQGIVMGKFINYDKHGSPTIKLKDSQGDIEEYIPMCFYNLYEAVQQYDSLCKPSGSLEYRIYRKDTVIKLYPVIDGDTLR